MSFRLHMVVVVVLVWVGVALVAPSIALAQDGNGIETPGADAQVSGSVIISGVAQHPTFRKWQVDLMLNDATDQATFLALGEEPVPTTDKLLTWDTTLYPDGDHTLRLRVVHSNLNYDEYFVPVTIANSGLAPAPEEKPVPDAETEAKELPAEPAPVVFRTDAPEDGKRWIEIDLSDQQITAWQGDVPVFATTVSTGRPGLHTLPGTFAVYRKYEQTRMTGPGYDTPDVPWTMYYYRGFAIHGAYWHDNFGTPVSHGCVNLRVPEAKAMFEWADVGTEVVVHE